MFLLAKHGDSLDFVQVIWVHFKYIDFNLFSLEEIRNNILP